MKFYSQEDEDFRKIKVSDDILPTDNSSMELLKYLQLSSKLLHLPFISKTCKGKESNESQIALNYDNVSFFAMVREQIFQKKIQFFLSKVFYWKQN